MVQESVSNRAFIDHIGLDIGYPLVEGLLLAGRFQIQDTDCSWVFSTIQEVRYNPRADKS